MRLTFKMQNRLKYLHALRDGKHIAECRKTENEYLDLLYLQDNMLELIKDKSILQEIKKSPQFPRKYPPPSADEICALRRSVDLSVAAMATICCVSTSSWRKWENGAIMPAPIWKLAQIMVEQVKEAHKKYPIHRLQFPSE